MRFAILFIFGGALVLGGCKHAPPTYVGDWATTDGAKLSVWANGDFSNKVRQMTFEGNWQLKDGDLVLNPEWLNGYTLEQARVALKPLLPPGPQTDLFFKELDQPSIYKMSDDGETMKTDLTRDPTMGDMQHYNRVKQP